eukprot:12331_1
MKPNDTKTITYGYCHEHETKWHIIIPINIQELITNYVPHEVSSNIIVSDKHIQILSEMNLIILPRDKKEKGDQVKIGIYSDSNIKASLCDYMETKPENETIVIGASYIGMGYIKVLCYKMNCEDNNKYYYDPNSYYTYMMDHYTDFGSGKHLENIKFMNIIDGAIDIWITKQRDKTKRHVSKAINQVARHIWEHIPGEVMNNKYQKTFIGKSVTDYLLKSGIVSDTQQAVNCLSLIMNEGCAFEPIDADDRKVENDINGRYQWKEFIGDVECEVEDDVIIKYRKLLQIYMNRMDINTNVEW